MNIILWVKIMLKRFSFKKISRYTILLFIVFLIYLFPKKEEYILTKDVKNEIDIHFHDVYLLDKNNYISKTLIEVKSKTKEDLIRELLEVLTIDGKYTDIIPNGFRSVLPVDTKLNNLTIDNNTLILDFDDNLLKVKEEFEEKIIEAIIYTMTSVDGIDNIKIKINNELLEKLPKSGKLLEETLDRNYGINKHYDVQTIKDISKVTIYYTARSNSDSIYYIPVTKYTNSKDEKIKIIIDELTSKISYESNLMSFLNYNTKLLDYNFNDDVLNLNFNEYLFDNDKNKKVLEEVIYSISYSIKDSYNVSKINFFVNNKEIK